MNYRTIELGNNAMALIGTSLVLELEVRERYIQSKALIGFS